MSNVPALKITPDGVVAPDSTTIRAAVLADENIAFGGDLDVITPSTPQAFLADQLTSNITDANAAVAYYVSQVDPANAEGRMQEGIARIYFLDRKGATASVVQALVTGQLGSTLAAGALAEDENGLLWQSTGTVSFVSSGSATIQFACLTYGPVQLGIGALTRIAQASPGWDAVTNLAPATLGSDVETRAEFELRRQLSVAKNAQHSPAAVRAAVFDIDGVIDVFVYDNFTNDTILYGATNYPLEPHSIYVGVVGGGEQEIAQAIISKISTGCGFNGNTTVVVQDTTYSYPYPAYNIKFNRPDTLPVLFVIRLANNPSLPSNIISLTKAAAINTLNGVNGAQRARMGGQIFASNYYAPIAAISSAVSIVGIKIGTTVADQDSISIGIDQEPNVTEENITVLLV
uniref:Baseplate protein J-like barrel domain-containing protein n=4 Tax=unclassified bacterial viruses TaxID=12333 RepID=A0AAU6W302_9VIRU